MIQLTEYRSYGRGAGSNPTEIANVQTLTPGALSTPFGPGVDVIGIGNVDGVTAFISLGQSPVASVTGIPVTNTVGVPTMLDVQPGWRAAC